MAQRYLSRRRFLTSAAVAGVSLLLASCGQQSATPTTSAGGVSQASPTTKVGGTVTPTSVSSKARYGGTITFVLENDVIDFDPMRSRAFVDRNVHYQIYDSLVRVDPKGNIIPWLAERWETAPDGKSVTFFLRQGVKFHDGTAFDASVVKWNLDRYRSTPDSARLS